LGGDGAAEGVLVGVGLGGKGDCPKPHP
jgi:hypothetical protein